MIKLIVFVSVSTFLSYYFGYHLGYKHGKADMVSMLEELKEQLRKMHEDYFETEHFDEAYGLSDSIAIIEQQIDDLKGEQA